MKLYRGKITVIAQELVQRLIDEGDVEVDPTMKAEAEMDIQSIMLSYLKQERRLGDVVRDFIALNQIDYDRRGEIRREKAKERNHPTGDRVMPYLAGQFNQMIMNSPNFDEVYSLDTVIRAKIFEVLRKHNVNENELREEARNKLKHLDENSMEYQILYRDAIAEVRRKRGLT